MSFRFWAPFVCTNIIFCTGCLSQDLTPGIAGMAPAKWVTIKSTHAPGRIYRSLNSQSKTYTQEDLYFRAWIPVVVNPKFALALGPHYRTEQLEQKKSEVSQDNQMDNWKLRSIGVDMKSFIKLDSTSWLITTAHVSQSGNLNDRSNSSIPLSYTFSAAYLKKKSASKEIGFGLMVNKTNNLTILPVFIFNYNFSSRFGVDMSLPHKLAVRYNVTKSDIIYIKSEAITRTYYINGVNTNSMFRRIDVDMGLAYNKQLNRFIGVELFGGYRQNISYKLPEGISSVRNSGWAASVEVYIRPPQGLRIGRKKITH